MSAGTKSAFPGRNARGGATRGARGATREAATRATKVREWEAMNESSNLRIVVRFGSATISANAIARSPNPPEINK